MEILIITLLSVAITGFVVKGFKTNDLQQREKETVFHEKKQEDFSDGMTKEERALQLILRKGLHGELPFLRKKRNLDSGDVDEFIYEDEDFTIAIYKSGENVWGKILLNKIDRFVCFFDKSAKSNASFEKEVLFYHRFLRQNDSLLNGFVKKMIETNWDNYKEFSEKEIPKESNRLDVLDEELREKVTHVLETYQEILLHKNELDVRTNHTITTLMEKDIKRLIQSYTHLEEEGRKEKRETFLEAIAIVYDKLDEVKDKINNNKLSELDESTEIIKKRLRK